MKRGVMLYLDEEIINKIDAYLKGIGSGAKRSPFIKEAVEYYLKVKTGMGFFKLK